MYFLKPCFSIVTVYFPAWTRSKEYAPLSLVWALKETPVASLERVTIAPATAAPLASCTVPVTRDVVPCPLATATRQDTKNKNAQIRFFILVPRLWSKG